MDELAQTIRRQRSQVEQEIVALSAETDPTTLRYKLVRPRGSLRLQPAILPMCSTLLLYKF